MTADWCRFQWLVGFAVHYRFGQKLLDVAARWLDFWRRMPDTLRMAWTILVIAGLLEIGWATGLKYAEGFTRLWPSVITVILMIASMWMLAVAVRTIPIGTGYAVWTGIGAVGTAIVGMALFGESTAALRLVCIVLIVGGIVGLKVLSSH